MSQQPVEAPRRLGPAGVVLAAYLWWGVSPLFWKQLSSVEPADQLAWRVLLGLSMLALYWAWRRTWPFPTLTRAHWTYGVASALAIASNWGLFLWAITADQALEAALGYFLMPLMAVAMGVGLLGERLRRLQSVALGLAVVGIIWALVVLGGVPWVALLVGATFALYGYLRKTGPWDAVAGLTFELAVVALPVALMLAGRALATDSPVVGNGDVASLALIALTGVVTVVPLLLFASAARRASLVAVGLLSYLNPVLQFLIGWQIFGESVPAMRLVGFGWVWAALALVIYDEVGRSQSAPATPRQLSQEP